MENLDWQPLYDKLIVRRDPPEKVLSRDADLVVPDSAQKEQHTGTVLRAGDGRWVEGHLIPLTVAPGMRVIFSEFAGIALTSKEPDVVVLREDEILAFAHPKVELREAS